MRRCAAALLAAALAGAAEASSSRRALLARSASPMSGEQLVSNWCAGRVQRHDRHLFEVRVFAVSERRGHEFRATRATPS